jgi:hypothetical protein
MELSYDYANILDNAKILTDIRPIYDESASGIEGAVVTQTLRIRFVSLNGNHDCSIAMDESDVFALAQQCERALQKARLARGLPGSSSPVPVIISGATDDV